MTSEVGFRDGEPHLIAGGGLASAILMVKSGDGGAIEQENFATREIHCTGGARWDTVPRWDLAMGGVTEVEAFASVLPAQVRSVTSDHDGHGFERLGVAKVAALSGEYCDNGLFAGHPSG